MPREQEFNADNIINNTTAQLDADFAQTIRELHASLSTAEASPVYTGFLARKIHYMAVFGQVVAAT